MAHTARARTRARRNARLRFLCFRIASPTLGLLRLVAAATSSRLVLRPSVKLRFRQMVVSESEIAHLLRRAARLPGHRQRSLRTSDLDRAPRRSLRASARRRLPWPRRSESAPRIGRLRPRWKERMPSTLHNVRGVAPVSTVVVLRVDWSERGGGIDPHFLHPAASCLHRGVPLSRRPSSGVATPASLYRSTRPESQSAVGRPTPTGARDAEREPQLARLLHRFVTDDDRSAGDRRVLLGSNHVDVWSAIPSRDVSVARSKRSMPRRSPARSTPQCPRRRRTL